MASLKGCCNHQREALPFHEAWDLSSDAKIDDSDISTDLEVSPGIHNLEDREYRLNLESELLDTALLKFNRDTLGLFQINHIGTLPSVARYAAPMKTVHLPQAPWSRTSNENRNASTDAALWRRAQ